VLHYAPLFIGFKVGVEKHSTEVIVKKSGSLLINSGIQGYSLLKTTQVFPLFFFVILGIWGHHSHINATQYLPTLLFWLSLSA
jgi:hypothetical protein